MYISHSFIHAFFFLKNLHTYIHTVHYESSQPVATKTGCDLNSGMESLTCVPHLSCYWMGVMHHWEPMICRQGACERVNVKLKPPTLADPLQSQGNKRLSCRDTMCSCWSFISSSRESGVLFDIRPTCFSDEHQSGVKSLLESPLWLSVLLCLTHNYPCVHVDTHSLDLSLSASRLIAVIKQRAVARSQSAVLLSTSTAHVGWNTQFFCTTRSEWMRS